MVPDSVSKHFPDFFTLGGKYPDMILTEQDWSITHISWRSFNRHPVRLLLADKADTSVYSYSNLKYTYSDTLRCKLLRRKWMV